MVKRWNWIAVIIEQIQDLDLFIKSILNLLYKISRSTLFGRPSSFCPMKMEVRWRKLSSERATARSAWKVKNRSFSPRRAAKFSRSSRRGSRIHRVSRPTSESPLSRSSTKCPEESPPKLQFRTSNSLQIPKFEKSRLKRRKFRPVTRLRFTLSQAKTSRFTRSLRSISLIQNRFTFTSTMTVTLWAQFFFFYSSSLTSLLGFLIFLLRFCSYVVRI